MATTRPHDPDQTTQPASPAQAAAPVATRGSTVPPGLPYHRVLAGEKRRVGRGILALALLIIGFGLMSYAVAQLAAAVDLYLFDRINPTFGGTVYTPIYHAGTMAGIAILIPWSMLLQRWLYRQPGASLHSVRSRFRFDLFGRALLVVGSTWAIGATLLTSLQPATEPVPWQLGDLYGVLLVTVLLTPLQSAGEEYGLRGLTFRIAASWARGARTALVLGVLVSALLFAFIHFSTDPWLNTYYLVFGVTLALIAWRTGGLEVPIVFHAVNNTFSYILMIVSRGNPLAALTDRAAGAGSPMTLLPCLFMLAMTGVVWWRTRAAGPPTT